MTEQRYSIPVEDLVASARVPVGEQVEEQADAHGPASHRSSDGNPYGDGMSADADGD